MSLSATSYQTTSTNDNTEGFKSSLISKNVTVRGHRTCIIEHPQQLTDIVAQATAISKT